MVVGKQMREKRQQILIIFSLLLFFILILFMSIYAEWSSSTVAVLNQKFQIQIIGFG